MSPRYASKLFAVAVAAEQPWTSFPSSTHTHTSTHPHNHTDSTSQTPSKMQPTHSQCTLRNVRAYEGTIVSSLRHRFHVQGVTGFGSAILNLCTWIVFVVARVDSGARGYIWQAVPARCRSSNAGYCTAMSVCHASRHLLLALPVVSLRLEPVCQTCVTVATHQCICLTRTAAFVTVALSFLVPPCSSSSSSSNVLHVQASVAGDACRYPAASSHM